MKKRLQGLSAGVLIGAMLTSGVVFARQISQTAELFYNNIRITVNGQEIQPKDGNGNIVEPFIIDGTTYLPVRAIANALNLSADWNGETNTVILSNTYQSTETAGTVVYDKDGIKISYKGIEYDNNSADIKFLIENNSNVGITVQARDESINGFMVSGIMSEDVQSGKKANAELTFYKSTLEENGITNIDEMELYFHIFNEETWDAIADTDIIKINP
ncbi:MAG: copper amine oxidase N-terminal domain-containing protein [Clostridia bacterium]|nr:copper amine oxidase N-terminal domain-containing protein [Clostridia bacterium]